MQPVSLAFFWHQHQPYYSDDVSGDTLMPWVRLHGTKDYYGMALHVKEVPEFRCTINLVPSLLKQLLAYTDDGRSDRHLDVSRTPADALSLTDACYLLDNFFMANYDNMIRPFARYQALYHKRGDRNESANEALRRFSAADIRDLQVWNNLTWIHPLVFAQDSDLKAFLDKGQHWTESEKNWLLDKQLDILRAVIPLHRELAEGGQVELTTTPFYHPIMPLLWDKSSAREAMPGCPLPQNTESYAADVKKQLDMAVEFHAELFGSAPTGLWPSEGSVSQAIVGAIADTGVEWIATDEEILAESTNGWVSRDYQGHMRHPEMLFRPWYCEDAGRKLQVVFRDHALSDLIGFHYQRSNPEHAANDLIGRAEGIGRAVANNNKDRPALVPVILDGENCWEYYTDGGVKFLRTLYQKCAQHPAIRPVRMIDHLREYPATDRIGHLFAGSWISHNFAIWIGHEEDRTAWDRLHETREFLVRAEQSGRGTPEVCRRAWEEIHIAEGSDWYWWFGDDHNSAQDELFDQLFRKHLLNVYTLLGAECPPILNQPISRAEHRAVHT
ncbi:MAG: glycoside hydrolase family 57 protein, partial [Planctomycetota bacterium]|nr:glycoside hydrolase family 57 protein [Planctomycetota bacterium]